jgi:hypothetical protein
VDSTHNRCQASTLSVAKLFGTGAWISLPCGSIALSTSARAERVGEQTSYAVEWMTYPLSRRHYRLVFIALGRQQEIDDLASFKTYQDRPVVTPEFLLGPSYELPDPLRYLVNCPVAYLA